MPAPPASPLVPEAAGPAPEPIGVAAAVPRPVAPPDFSEDRAPTDKAMAEAGVTEAQMARSNEPDFTATVHAREGAEQQEALHAKQFGAGQAGILAGQTDATGAMLAGGMGGIHDKRGGGLGAVAGKQSAAKAAEAAERTRITTEIERIKTATREDVVRMLDDMETSATKFFEAGLTLAEAAYQRAFDDAKGGAVDWLTNWGDDWKEHLEAAFRTARSEYDRIVSETIDSVADIVETRLALAKARVQQGRKEVDVFVAGLDKSVRGFGEEARTSIGADFDAMEGEIDAKRDAIVSSLADQYRESQKRVSALEEKLREANKSVWERIYDATVGIIKKIIAFKDFLLGLLARVAQVVSAIIDDPIGFLGNLIGGIMDGLDGFQSRIGEHLKKGLLGWLFGALEGAGLKIPETLDLKGIIDLVMQVLGLTWENIRRRAVKILGEETVAYLEKTWDIFLVLVREGPAGLWQMLAEKIGDIKDMILTQVGEWVEEKIIVAGIKWVLSLLNPVAAFIKACMAIYDIVKFFVDRAAQIAELINAILDTLGAIVSGNVSAMAKSVEGALARMIPVAIGFLASLLGLGGISEKIRAVIAKLQAPVNAAIDWIIGKAKGMVQKAGAALFGKKGKKAAAAAAPAAAPPKPGDQEVGEVLAVDSPEGGHRMWVEPSGEVMMATKPLPLSTHLKRFEKEAKEIEDDKIRAALLKQIGDAKPLAKNIEKNAKAIKKLTIDTPKWRETDEAIETDEEALRPLLVFILKELEAGVPTRIDKPIVLWFTPAEGMRKGEYDRQLKDQAEGINDMSIETFVYRRAIYAGRKEHQRKQGVPEERLSGRDPRSGKAQADVRNAVKLLLVQRMMLSENTRDPLAADIERNEFHQWLVKKMFRAQSDHGRKRGLSQAKAVEAVKEATGKNEATDKHQTAALHNPDQTAGGRYDDVEGLGDYDINRDIGWNWGGMNGKPIPLRRYLEGQVMEAMTRLKVRRPFWRAVRMVVDCKRA